MSIVWLVIAQLSFPLSGVRCQEISLDSLSFLQDFDHKAKAVIFSEGNYTGELNVNGERCEARETLGKALRILRAPTVARENSSRFTEMAFRKWSGVSERLVKENKIFMFEVKSSLCCRNGWGQMLWRNGTTYGPNDIFYYSDGDKYIGQWKNNLQHGETSTKNSLLAGCLLDSRKSSCLYC